MYVYTEEIVLQLQNVYYTTKKVPHVQKAYKHMLKSNSNECAWNYRAKSALYKNPGYTSWACPMYVYVYVCMYALGCLWCDAKVLVYLLGCLPSKQLEAFSFPLLPAFILMGQGRSPTSDLRLNRGITWSIAVEHIGCEHTHTHTHAHTHAHCHNQILLCTLS